MFFFVNKTHFDFLIFYNEKSKSTYIEVDNTRTLFQLLFNSTMYLLIQMQQ